MAKSLHHPLSPTSVNGTNDSRPTPNLEDYMSKPVWEGFVVKQCVEWLPFKSEGNLNNCSGFNKIKAFIHNSSYETNTTTQETLFTENVQMTPLNPFLQLSLLSPVIQKKDSFS